MASTTRTRATANPFLEAAAEAAVPIMGDAIQFAGEALRKGLGEIRRGTEKGTLGVLTDETVKKGVQGPTSDQFKGAIRFDTIEDDKGNITGTQAVRDEGYKTPSGQYAGHFPKEEGTYPSWAGAAYENPETASKLAGYGAVAATLGAAGLGLGALAGGGTKPQSAYRVPVQPSGGYNPSVESAMASAQAKYDLQEQKHRHNLEMQALREQARIPGPQDVSSGPYGGAPIQSSHAGVLDGSDIQHLARSIYGTGARMF